MFQKFVHKNSLWPNPMAPAKTEGQPWYTNIQEHDRIEHTGKFGKRLVTCEG